MPQCVSEPVDEVLGITVSQNGSASSFMGSSLIFVLGNLDNWLWTIVEFLSRFACFGFGLWLSCVPGFGFVNSTFGWKLAHVPLNRPCGFLGRRGVWSWIMTVVIALNCRVGEAAVPGPGPLWSIGLCNPSGLNYKGHLLDQAVDMWAVCESHLSSTSQCQFVAALKKEKSPFQWLVPGAPVPCRSTASSIGAWSGVALIAQWPSRPLHTNWSPALWASGRLVCAATHIHGLWVTGITMYGTPTGPTHPKAKATTNALLDAAVSRIAQAQGPRYVAGDWNHDLDALEAVNGLRALGFVEAQELHCTRTGVLPLPTCRSKTRRDFVFLSPELRRLFESCIIDHTAWPDHSAVIVCFKGGVHESVRYPWPLPAQVPDGNFIDFSSVSDVTDQYATLWRDVETCAEQCAIGKSKPLPRVCFGRGQRLEPLVVKALAPPVSKGRSGDLQPGFYGSSWGHAHMFRQARRLQSYTRLVRHCIPSVSHQTHAVALWRSILHASGFQPCIGIPLVPQEPPEHAVALLIFQFVEQHTRDFEKQLRKHRSYASKLARKATMGNVYASVRRDPPAPVESLIQSRSATIAHVDREDVAVEFDEEVEWLENCPFISEQGPLQPVVVTPDKLWLESIHDLQPGHRVRPVDAPSVQWSRGLLKATILSKKKGSATGVDGVSRADLLSLQLPHLDSLLSLFQRIESDGNWPAQPLIGAVRSLVKNSTPGDVQDYRPITVLGMCYRVWGTIHARHWLKCLDKALDPFMLGSRSGCRASHLWRYVLDQVEASHTCQCPLAGVVLDLAKAFNTLPRYPTMAIAKMLGVATPTLLGWSGALGSLQRRFVIQGSFSEAVFSSCGYPEGCALSCLAMVCVDQVFHLWLKAGSGMCAPLTYVDNWELLFADVSFAQRILDRALEFTSQWDLTIDMKKTIAWATTKKFRSELRGFGFRVVSDTRDLGAHLTFTRQLRNSTLLQRVYGLDDFWRKLAVAKGSHVQKVQAVKCAAWPRALHGVSAVIVGKKHWQSLRSSYMKAFRHTKPGASPWLQLLLDGFSVDPQQYAIWNTILDYRSVGCNDVQRQNLDDLLLRGCNMAVASVSEVLCHRLHQLGWTVLPDGWVQDRFGRFHLGSEHIGSLQFRFGLSWNELVASQVSSRLDFVDFNKVHVAHTRQGIRRFPLPDQAALKAVMNGTTFTNRHAYHWSDDGSCACPTCGSLDSLHHKYWECPWVSDLYEQVPAPIRELVESLPSCMADRGWTPRLSLSIVWAQCLLQLLSVFDFRPVDSLPDGVLDLFTDGSCLWGSDPDLRIASWSVCVGSRDSSGSSSDSFRIVAAQPLSGFVQTAYRAELQAVDAALCFALQQGRECRIWTDCLSVLTRFRLLVDGNRRLGENSAHSDIWQSVMDRVEQLGASRVVVAKVKAHCKLEVMLNEIECWLCKGNNAADRAAKQANQDRGAEFWRLHKTYGDAVVKSRCVGDTIREHLVRVNRRWLQHSQTGGSTPEVHATRQAREHTMMWQCDGPPQRVSGRFRKLFGHALVSAMWDWWHEIIDFSDSAEVKWISYAELYIDWQIQCRHPGVVKVQGHWYDASSPEIVAESYTFRARCKWFRLMVQQWAKDVCCKFSKVTCRPDCQWLACHIGCAAMPVKSARRHIIHEWLRKHLASPVLGLGSSLDTLPPGW